MRNWVLFAAGLLLTALVGCAATPEHLVKGDRYSNNNLSFSATIPSGWTFYERLPDDLQEQAGIRPQNYFQGPVFFSHITEGLIAFRGTTSDWDWVAFEGMAPSDKVIVTSRLINTILKKPSPFPTSNHKAYKENLHTTYKDWMRNRSGFKPAKLLDFQFKPQKPLPSGIAYMYGEFLMYPYSPKQAISLVIILSSKQGSQSHDVESFRSLVSSIRATD